MEGMERVNDKEREKAKEEAQAIVKAEYADIFELAASFDEDDIISSSKCKLCKSPNRFEAEEYWEQKKQNNSAVVRFLQDKGEDISDKAVASHMREHYLPQQKRLLVKGYADKLKAYAGIKNDRLADIAVSRAVLIKELMEIGAQSEELPLFERRKNAETIIKLVGQILACDEQERKHNEEWKPAKIIVEKLEQIIQVELDSAPAEAKPVLAKVVQTLFNDLEGVK